MLSGRTFRLRHEPTLAHQRRSARVLTPTLWITMTDDTFEELPREEALVRLYELRDRIDKAIASRGVLNPRSESERHRQERGHALAFGCCRATTTRH